MYKFMVQFTRSDGNPGARTERILRTTLDKVLTLEGFPKHTVWVVWISNKESTEVNYQMKKKRTPGDVFSFPRAEREMLGEILIAPQYGRTMARKMGCDVNDLLLRWGVHGLFHLLGYDHETPDDYSHMIQKERRVISSVGREWIDL